MQLVIFVNQSGVASRFKVALHLCRRRAGCMAVRLFFRRVVQLFEQLDLLGNGELATAAAASFQAEPAAVIRTPLAVSAIRTGMFLGGLVAHQ